MQSARFEVALPLGRTPRSSAWFQSISASW